MGRVPPLRAWRMVATQESREGGLLRPSAWRLGADADPPPIRVEPDGGPRDRGSGDPLPDPPRDRALGNDLGRRGRALLLVEPRVRHPRGGRWSRGPGSEWTLGAGSGRTRHRRARGRRRDRDRTRASPRLPNAGLGCGATEVDDRG